MVPLTNKWALLREKLNKTRPTTLAGAIVKLRQLADAEEGIEAGLTETDSNP